MDESLLSVIVPIYNVENYLEQCLDSILNQTYKNLEIILVDDGSTDSSGKVCDQYAQKDCRISVIHKNNEGLISARAVGLKKATSVYVTFVDSDDWISPFMYEYLMQKMVDYNVDMVTSGCVRYFDEKKQIKSYDNKIKCGLYDLEAIGKKIIPIMLWNNETEGWALDPSLCMKIFKKELLLKQFERLKNEKFYYGEDSAVIFPYILEINSLFCTWEIFYYHRQRTNGMIPKYFTEDDFFDKMIALYHSIYATFIKSQYKDSLVKQLDFFYMKSIQYHSLKYGIKNSKKRMYLFPFHMVSNGSKIVLYGAGDIGIQYFLQLNRIKFCDIVSWIDRKFADIKEYAIESPDVVKSVEFDYIVIAILDENIRNEIKGQLLDYGINAEKIITCVPEGYFY